MKIDSLKEKIDLIEKAHERVRDHLRKSPDDLALKIVESQLGWLRGFVVSGSGDPEKIMKIQLAVLAAREIETLDFELAETLYEIQDTLNSMLSR